MGKSQKLRLPLTEYRQYAKDNIVDFPYYPWERDFEGAQTMRSPWTHHAPCHALHVTRCVQCTVRGAPCAVLGVQCAARCAVQCK